MMATRKLCVGAASVFGAFLGIVTLLPILRAQDTRAQSKNCVFQDGSNFYRLQGSEGGCPNPIQLQKNLTQLSAFVKSQVDNVERKIAEMMHNSAGTDLRGIRQDIADIKTNQQVLERAIVRTNRQLSRLGGREERCKSGYMRNGTSCYKFVEHANTWFEAEIFCMAQGAHLVSIETMEENAFLLDYMNRTNRFRAYNIWTGGNDLEIEGQFTWVGTNQVFPISAWAPGEPNNYGSDHEGQNGVENCMMITYNYGWSDGVCRTRTYFICEHELS